MQPKQSTTSGARGHTTEGFHSPQRQLLKQRCVAVVNPVGGNGRCGLLWAQLAPHIKARLAAQGMQLEEQLTRGPGGASSATVTAVASAADVVLAVGGDGTMHEAASGMVQAQQGEGDTHTWLAMLPLGTGSDYARAFGWQLNSADDACDRVLRGRQVLADVSCVRTWRTAPPAEAAPPGVHAAGPAAAGGGTNTTSSDSSTGYVLNVASCAVGALSSARAASLKQWGGLCYSLGAALELAVWRDVSIQVCLDDAQSWQTLEGLTTLVWGHGRYWGGGLQILPTADPCDGCMDVIALQGLRLWDFISKGHLLRSGQHLGVKGVHALGRCRRLRVRPTEPGVLLPWEFDGEPQPGGGYALIDAVVLPGALRLLA